jgi:hypothetical protein
MAVAVLLLLVSVGRTDVIEYPIRDIATFTTYYELNTGQTYAGTGFVGYWSHDFVHLFGVEGYDHSRTALEVDIRALAGATIDSAVLSFDLLEGMAGVHNVVLTSFSAGGLLGYFWTPPDNLGTLNATVRLQPFNTVDVTNLLQNRVDAGADWFGLHLRGADGLNQYTLTHTGFGYHSDRANVRLTVHYTIPEPAALLFLAFGAFALPRRRHPDSEST